jgi:phage tail-like protein
MAILDLSLKDNRPISSFNFYVGLEGSAVFDSFQSVSGIGATMEMEKMDDYGHGNEMYSLPGHVKFEPLVLKKGLLKSKSPLTSWCYDYLCKHKTIFTCSPKTIIVCLVESPTSNKLDSKNIVMQWTFFNCIPSSIKMDDFDSQNSSLAIETVELTYSHLSFNNPN